ncbi:MAG TPA: prenyltransferase [Myxococcota bacterium]|nr:prenyltransferase [Myxococcota bacterium]
MTSAIRNWGEIIRTQNLSPDKAMDGVSRWLLITRASVFPMTILSGLIGGLLAAHAPGADLALCALAVVGLVIAHAANNMINDYFDLESGVDSAEYVRAQYAPHPVLSGLISKKGLLLAIALANLVDLAILIWLAGARGPALVVFALLGLFVSVFYVAPPVKLKHHGLGEPGVFLVWGPLMIGGTYYATAGTVAPWVLVASVPYALLVTCVLMGKHVDKIEADTAKGIHTLPVILGRDRALALTRGLMIAFFALVAALVATGALGVWTLLSFAAIPRVRKVLPVFRRPKPAAPPPRYPLWPLWYVSFAFLVTRTAGGWLVIGLVLDAIYPLHLPALWA